MATHEAVPAFGADGLDRGRAQTRLLGDHVEHAPDPLDARIRARAIDDGALAHDVVAYDHRAGPREPQRPGEILRVARLVGVDEDEIERADPLLGDARQGFQRRADAQAHLPGEARARDVVAGDLGVLGNRLERHDETVRRQGASEPDRRIAAERADLQHLARAAPCARAGRAVCPAAAETSIAGRPAAALAASAASRAKSGVAIFSTI